MSTVPERTSGARSHARAREEALATNVVRAAAAEAIPSIFKKANNIRRRENGAGALERAQGAY
jgi:hypothetical protein